MKNITLEMSLKPFKKTDDAFVRSVCRKLFTQWAPLVRHVPVVSVMLWVGDGSELLDYRGDADIEFEWGKYAGGANPQLYLDQFKKNDPEGVGLHSRSYLYTDDPPVMTYGILRRIICTLREVGHEILGEDKVIRIGETFDPGPEFAVSPFKYERHREICSANVMGVASFVCSYAKLHADNVSYAGFPDGIPEGLPFGTFFGRQAQCFLTDMGFDYIWFSNGLGFGRDIWSTTGAIFDGHQFHCENFEAVKEEVRSFWSLFRAECPDFPIETRGTNMSLGIDMATDGVPLRDLYEGGYNMLPPPNSPWAALDGDFGLELMGYMSRIAEVPGDDAYLFRYYIHDPWWMNSPWYDRYNGQPHDIYMPLACARINAKGEVCPPTNMNFLTVDNTYGEMPDCCVYEPLPHLLRALKNAPDAPSPLVWAYPFRLYSDCHEEGMASRMFAGDWYIRGAINSGFPLSTVISTDHMMGVDPSLFSASVIVTPTPEAGSAFEEYILNYIKEGGRVLFYGPLTHTSERFRTFVGAALTEKTFEGELSLFCYGKAAGVLKHTAVLSGGPIDTVATGTTQVILSGGEYVLGTAGDGFVWLRATSSNDFRPGSPLLVPHDEARYARSETFALRSLVHFGFDISFVGHEAGQRYPVFMISRNDHAWWLSTYHPSTTVETRCKTPLGAPVLMGYETRIVDGYACYHFPKADNRECRVFVEMEDGIVSAWEQPPVSYWYRRRICVSGLKNATVRLFGETYCADLFEVRINSQEDNYFLSDEFQGKWKTDGYGTYYEIHGVTGTLTFSFMRPELMEPKRVKKHSFLSDHPDR